MTRSLAEQKRNQETKEQETKKKSENKFNNKIIKFCNRFNK